MEKTDTSPPEAAMAPPRPMAPAPTVLLAKLSVAPTTVEPDPGGSRRTDQAEELESDDEEDEDSSAPSAARAAVAIKMPDMICAEEVSAPEAGAALGASPTRYCQPYQTGGLYEVL